MSMRIKNLQVGRKKGQPREKPTMLKGLQDDVVNPD